MVRINKIEQNTIWKKNENMKQIG